MAYTISEALDKLVGREDVASSVRSLVRKESAVARILDAVRNPVKTLTSPVFSVGTQSQITFSTWSNTGTKTSQALDGTMSEVLTVRPYAIVAYDKDLEVEVESFAEEFAVNVANGFATWLDDYVLNTATTGVLPAASGVSNTYPTTISGATSYQLRTDLVNTMGLVLADGFSVNGIIGEMGEETDVLNAVSTTGQPIFLLDDAGTVTRLLGKPYAATFVTMTNDARFVVGDWTQVQVGIYERLTSQKFESGTVTIGGNDVNLIEENKIAVRVEGRVAFKVLNAAAFAYLYELSE